MAYASLVVNIIAAVSAALAVITALYVYWDSSSPDVQVFLKSDTDHGCTSLVVRNYGKKPAYDVQINGFNFDFVQSELLRKVKTSFIVKGIPMLAPEQQRATIVYENQLAAVKLADISVEGTVTFKKKSICGLRTISSQYVLDYYSFANSLYIHSDVSEIKTSLQKIAKSLEKMS